MQLEIAEGRTLDWREIDRALRRLASRRSGLDAEEARWLRAAEAHQIWRPLGMVSALDYLERALGHAPHTARERLRVARALGELHGHRLDDSELIAVLCRAAAERAACASADAATNPKVEVDDDAAEDAADDAADAAAPAPRGERTDHAAASRVRATAPAAAGRGPATFQIALTLCERCGAGWQDGGGVAIPVAPAVVERARCDAQHLGSVHAAAPAAAHQDIPPAVARLVRRRDHGGCRVPGCRSAIGIELHHLVPRSAGGPHTPANLVCLCSACHQAHHDGRLRITGTADALVVERPAEPAFPRGTPRAVAAGAGHAARRRDPRPHRRRLSARHRRGRGRRRLRRVHAARSTDAGARGAAARASRTRRGLAGADLARLVAALDPQPHVADPQG